MGCRICYNKENNSKILRQLSFFSERIAMKTRLLIMMLMLTAFTLLITQCSPAASVVPTNTAIPEKPTVVPPAGESLTPTIGKPVTLTVSDTPVSVASATSAVAASSTSAEVASDTPAVVSTGGGTALDGKALAEKACTACHTFDRIQNARKTGAEWNSTVQRMVGKGAQLTPDEQQAVIDYLSKTYPK